MRDLLPILMLIGLSRQYYPLEIPKDHVFGTYSREEMDMALEKGWVSTNAHYGGSMHFSIDGVL